MFWKPCSWQRPTRQVNQCTKDMFAELAMSKKPIEALLRTSRSWWHAPTRHTVCRQRVALIAHVRGCHRAAATTHINNAMSHGTRAMALEAHAMALEPITVTLEQHAVAIDASATALPIHMNTLI